MQIIEEMLDELREETKLKVGSMKEPNYAYVLFEVPKTIYTMDSKNGKIFEQRAGFGIGHINLENQPGQMWKVRHELEINKNKLIAFGNFPTKDDPDARRRQKYHAHRDETGVTPWDIINDYLVSFVKGKRNTVKQLKLSEEVETLRKQNELMAQELKKHETRPNSKSI